MPENTPSILMICVQHAISQTSRWRCSSQLRHLVPRCDKIFERQDDGEARPDCGLVKKRAPLSQLAASMLSYRGSSAEYVFVFSAMTLMPARRSAGGRTLRHRPRMCC